MNPLISEGNAEILKYMWRTSIVQIYYEGISVYQIADLKYHESWDWLMPVVEKISKHLYTDKSWDGCEPYSNAAYPYTFGMPEAETGRPMVRFHASQLFIADTLIEATWLAVVDWVKWYNEENK